MDSEERFIVNTYMISQDRWYKRVKDDFMYKNKKKKKKNSKILSFKTSYSSKSRF